VVPLATDGSPKENPYMCHGMAWIPSPCIPRLAQGIPVPRAIAIACNILIAT